MAEEKYTGIVLAGGKNSRMGRMDHGWGTGSEGHSCDHRLLCTAIDDDQVKK